MCGGLFSFCFLYETVFENGQVAITHNGLGIAEGGVYLHNRPSEAQKLNVVQLLISGTSAPTFGNTLLVAGVLKLSK